MSVKNVKTKIKNLLSYFSTEQMNISVKRSGSLLMTKYDTPWLPASSYYLSGSHILENAQRTLAISTPPGPSSHRTDKGQLGGKWQTQIFLVGIYIYLFTL